jgi:WD40 repeat protein
MAQATAVQVWDAEKFKKRATLSDPRRPLPDVLGSLTFSPDGKTLAVGDSMLVLWDVAKGKPKVQVPMSRGSSNNAVVFSPDGKTVATVRADGLVCLANAETGKLQFASQAGKFVAAASAAFSDDAKTLVTGETDFTVRQWDAAKGKVRSTFSLKGKNDLPANLVFAPDGKSAVTSTIDSGTTVVWDLTTGKPRMTLKRSGKVAVATQMAFAPDGATLAVGAVDGTVTLWDLSTEKELMTLRGNKGSIHRLAFSADGTTLASGDEKGNVYVWSVRAEMPRR